jgi:hypothetical protein
MKTVLVDGQTLKEMVASGIAWLEEAAPDINAIDIFAIPNGDTGTKMVLTITFALEEAKLNSGAVWRKGWRARLISTAGILPRHWPAHHKLRTRGLSILWRELNSSFLCNTREASPAGSAPWSP